MIKINIKNRQNLTLLAKAFMDHLFVQCKMGEMFYDKDERNEIRFIYFDSNYFKLLKADVFNPEKLARISLSNMANQWRELLEVFNTYEEAIEIDYGKLFLYDIGESNYSIIEIPQERVDNVLSLPFSELKEDNELYKNIEADLKRIYIGKKVNITRFTNGRGISVKVPFKDDAIQRFPFKPIIDILKKYKQEIEDINLFKGEHQQEFYITIKILNWSN
jgi:hypothetical protein